MHPMLKKLADCGQSIWYDNIRRGMLASGEMQALIDDGVVGVTSNPSIFEKAIAHSNDYDEQIRALIDAGHGTAEIFDSLALADIGAAADLFRPVYDRTDGHDGYVSIEVNPHLAHDTDATIAEARRLFRTLDRPNIMVKIPGTPEGIPAIATAIGEGINVNVTLIFSVDAYRDIMQAYLTGLQRLGDAGGKLNKVASVASFFVSRVDTVVDKQLAQSGAAKDLLGKAAIANSKLAYQAYLEVFDGPAFGALRQRGARVQRPLWASTSTKNPDYPKTLYVDTLIGPDTVNTVPPVTLDAIREGITVKPTLTADVDAARKELERLKAAGISLEQVTEDLRTAGVKAFADSYDQLLASLESKRLAMAN
ncbi:MAG TPA: transaldolase [Phycisphaerae bacterium]|nr:transaldolase [Phycisphaerae bacterium]